MAYCMTHTPIFKLVVPGTLTDVPFLPSKPYNYSTAKYRGAQAKYDELELLRVAKAVQDPKKLRKAVSQHWIPLYAEMPSGTCASCSASAATCSACGTPTPFTLDACASPCDLAERLLSMSPTLVRAHGDFDPDGVRLHDVWVVRVSCVKPSQGLVEVEMRGPPQADNAMGTVANARQCAAVGRALYSAFQPRTADNPSGGLFPAGVLRPGLVLWLLKVSELPSLPAGADGRNLMHRVAVTLPAPAELRQAGHHVAQAFSMPLGFQSSVSETEWGAVLESSYSPGLRHVPLSAMHAYPARMAAANINSVAPGAMSDEAIAAAAPVIALPVQAGGLPYGGFVAARGDAGSAGVGLGLGGAAGGSDAGRATPDSAAGRVSTASGGTVGGGKRTRGGSCISSPTSMPSPGGAMPVAEGAAVLQHDCSVSVSDHSGDFMDFPDSVLGDGGPDSFALGADLLQRALPASGAGVDGRFDDAHCSSPSKRACHDDDTDTCRDPWLLSPSWFAPSLPAARFFAPAAPGQDSLPPPPHAHDAASVGNTLFNFDAATGAAASSQDLSGSLAAAGDFTLSSLS